MNNLPLIKVLKNGILLLKRIFFLIICAAAVNNLEPKR